MSLDLYKILGAFFIFIASILAIAYPIKNRTLPSHHPSLEFGDAFASGIFLGVALFHMLPDAIGNFSDLYPTIHYPLAELCCAIGFLVLLLFQRIAEISHTEHHHKTQVPLIVAAIIIIHSLIEGAALGINTSLATATLIFLAIIAHKSSESFALAIILNRSTLTKQKIIFIVSVFSIMTPLGIAAGTFLTSNLQFQQGELLTAIFNAFAAGSFLYMSTLHHINHHEREHHEEGLFEFIALCLGLSVMALVALWV